MVKFICDACGKELSNERKFYFDYLEKISHNDQNSNSIIGYKRKKKHFCLKCYFEIVEKLLNEIKIIRETNGE